FPGKCIVSTGIPSTGVGATTRTSSCWEGEFSEDSGAAGGACERTTAAQANPSAAARLDFSAIFHGRAEGAVSRRRRPPYPPVRRTARRSRSVRRGDGHSPGPVPGRYRRDDSPALGVNDGHIIGETIGRVELSAGSDRDSPGPMADRYPSLDLIRLQ